jgi:signal transduction histidine kinase
MAVFGNMIKQGSRDFIPPAAVLVVGLALSIAVFVTVRGYYADADRQQFQRDAGYYTATFKTSVERHVASLTAIRAFVSSSHEVNRWEFSAFANQILPRNSGFKAVLWLGHISAAQRPGFERNMQRDGLYGLRLRELTPSHALVSAASRSTYLPVAFVEPFEGSGSLIGVDLSNNPIYAPLFETARKTGRAAVSSVLARALVNTQGPVVVAAFPLSRRVRAEASSAAGRPEGYALGILELERVIAEAMGNLTTLQAALAHKDARGQAAILAGRQGQRMGLKEWVGNSEFHQLVPFEIAGKQFALALRSGSQRDLLTRLYVPAEAALLVIALAVLLAQSMLTTILRKRQVEKAVIARTAELRALNQTLLGEIDQRRQAEVELRHARDKAESANRAKSAFMSTMSHELRTPLNAIIGFSGILTQSAHDMDYRTRDYLAEINASGLKLLELINDILEITQMEAGGAQASDLVFVADLVDAALAAIGPLADKGAVSLRRDMAENLPPLRGDGKRLQKALYNLLSNAVKFTASGGWAQVCAHASAEWVVIEVRDSGVGMAAIADGLNIFSQGDSSLTRRHEGMGLGLTYVKRVADQHDARLEITSEVGVGTCVRMFFKVDQPANIREVA